MAGAPPKAAIVPAVAFSALASATGDFAHANKIGSGATGEVFRGTLNGGPVAVKRLNLPAGSSAAAKAALERQFQTELAILSSYQHSRIVQLNSHAIDQTAESGHPFALVFEFLQGGSLADHLRPNAANTDSLTASQRINIALGACSGLCFLHGLREAGEGEGAPTVPVLHRDIKSANIGLAMMPDGTYFSKLLDCGIAKALQGPQGAPIPAAGAGAAAPVFSALSSTTVSIRGTRGYMAPELVAKPASIRSEVFAFGVVLLELFAGRLVGPSEALDFHGRVEDDGNTSCIEALADSVWPKEAVGSLAGLIAACIHNRDTRRPKDMTEVKNRLQEIRQSVPALMQTLVYCPSCLSDVPVKEGVCCTGGKDGTAQKHFICFGCLQHHVRTKSTPEALRANEGAIPCPEVGCQSPAWAVEELPLDPGTVLAFAVGIRKHAFDSAKAKREAEAAAAAAEAAARNQAATLAERVSQLRLLVVEQDLTMHCPRCDAAFVDFNGCNCLECASCEAGFCACCLKDCGSKGEAHTHYETDHAKQFKDKGYFDIPFFESSRKARCTARLVARLRKLADDPALQAALLTELAKADLAPLGITKQEVELVLQKKNHLSGLAATAVSRLIAGLEAVPFADASVQDALEDITALASEPGADGVIGREALIEAKAAEALVRSIGAEACSGQTIYDVCAAIFAIADNSDSSTSTLVQAGVAGALTKALSLHAQSATVLSAAGWAISGLAMRKRASNKAAAWRALVEARTMEPLLHATVPMDKGAAISVCTAIGNLAFGNDAGASGRRAALIKYGAADCVTRILTSVARSSSVFQAAALAAMGLSSGKVVDDAVESAVTDALVSAGAVEALLKAMKEVALSSRGAMRTCDVISYVAAGATASAQARRGALVKFGAGECMTRALKAHPGSASVFEAAAYAARKLSAGNDDASAAFCCQHLVDEGAMEALLRGMATVGMSDVAAVEACFAIGIVASLTDAEADARRTALIGFGAADGITRALSSHGESAPVFEAAAYAAAELVLKAVDAAQPLVNAKTTDVLLQGMMGMEPSKAATARVCAVIYKVASGADERAPNRRSALIKAGAAECLTRAMARFPQTGEMFKPFRLAVSALSAGGEEEFAIEQELIDAGTMAELFKGLERFELDEEAAADVCTTIRNLAKCTDFGASTRLAALIEAGALERINKLREAHPDSVAVASAADKALKSLLP